MRPRRLASGNLLVPVRLEADDGTIGDGLQEIGPNHPDFAAWLAELDDARVTARDHCGGIPVSFEPHREPADLPVSDPGLDEPPSRFLNPELPAHFTLEEVDAQGVSSAGGSFGPFDRTQVIREPDGAIVFLEDGSLPMRLGVARQDGNLLHLHPGGVLRVRPSEGGS